jgi:hypothetical protein
MLCGDSVGRAQRMITFTVSRTQILSGQVAGQQLAKQASAPRRFLWLGAAPTHTAPSLGFHANRAEEEEEQIRVEGEELLCHVPPNRPKACARAGAQPHRDVTAGTEGSVPEAGGCQAAGAHLLPSETRKGGNPRRPCCRKGQTFPLGMGAWPTDAGD